MKAPFSRRAVFFQPKRRVVSQRLVDLFQPLPLILPNKFSHLSLSLSLPPSSCILTPPSAPWISRLEQKAQINTNSTFEQWPPMQASAYSVVYATLSSPVSSLVPFLWPRDREGETFRGRPMCKTKYHRHDGSPRHNWLYLGVSVSYYAVARISILAWRSLSSRA